MSFRLPKTPLSEPKAQTRQRPIRAEEYGRKNEIIDNTSYTKGGDGGCSFCGGDGAVYVLPCYLIIPDRCNLSPDYQESK